VTSGPELEAPAALVLQVENLTLDLNLKTGTARPVDHVSFHVSRGETLGLVGESGSGKSLTALTIAGLQPRPVARVVEGSVRIKGQEIVGLPDRELRQLRGAVVSMILQDPMSALNPVMRVGTQIRESLRLHQSLSRREQTDRAVELLELLQIRDARKRLAAYPHELSGGMCQRVVGAIALASSPALLIADEPTTALDVTAQHAYLTLLRRIQVESDLAILFVTHDFSVVHKLCDRVAVMYAGEIVEVGAVPEIFTAAQHPYTQALIRSVPDVRVERQSLLSIPGRPPSPAEPPTGCRFHPRCWLYEQLGRPERCRVERPAPRDTESSKAVKCHFPGESLATEPVAAAGEAEEVVHG